MNKSSDLEKYIFEQGEKRERTAIVRLIADRSSWLSNVFQDQLNLFLPWCWLGIRIPQRSLLKGLELENDDFRGDVDFFGGNLEPISQAKFLEYVSEYKNLEAHPSWAYKFAEEKLLFNGEIKWIPSLDFIIASECKASYFSSKDKLKVAKFKGQKKHRGQTKELCELGFNKIALTKIIATEPIESTYLHPWFEAGNRASKAQEITENKTVVEDSDLFGTVIVSVGAVKGGLEDAKGSISHRWLKDVPENQTTVKSKLLRETIEKNLKEIMNQYSTPRQVPVLLLSCSNPKCLFVYVSEANADALCPKCNGNPR